MDTGYWILVGGSTPSQIGLNIQYPVSSISWHRRLTIAAVYLPPSGKRSGGDLHDKKTLDMLQHRAMIGVRECPIYFTANTKPID